MKTFLAQNEFIPNSSVISPRTEGSAAASKPPPVADATAAPFSCAGAEPATSQADHDGEALGRTGCSIQPTGARPPSNEGRPSEASAPAPTKNPDADALDCIHEIFFYARKLMKQPQRFVLDEAAFMADVEEVPLFIREDGYLKRQA